MLFCPELLCLIVSINCHRNHSFGNNKLPGRLGRHIPLCIYEVSWYIQTSQAQPFHYAPIPCPVGFNGPRTRYMYVILRVAHATGMPGTFSPPPRVSDPDMDHGTCVTHVPWSMPGSLTSGFLWSRWRGKRSRHFRRMRNPQFCVSGKRPMVNGILISQLVTSRGVSPWNISSARVSYFTSWASCDGLNKEQ